MNEQPASAGQLDQLCVNTIRTLSMDAVQRANSGHPGTPMAMAPVAYCLWQRILRFDPNDPIWPNRDRFVLSMGHASMLLYSLLHLAGVKAVNPKYERPGEAAVTLDDIERFRQLDSKCPGHPEYRWTSGIETTTGPLGQGVATSVGMAISAKWQAHYFNRPGFKMFDYDVYALCGDGCMMEGVSAEAASLAGHLGLANLYWIYDNNKITIECATDWAFSEDVATRFVAYGWNVTKVGDANDLGMLERAFATFRKTQDRPTLIIVDSRIGYIHKELELDDVEQRFPAQHYVLVDDKLRILTAVKNAWRARVTTVFPRQGHYALDPKVPSRYPPADVTLERIGELLDIDLPAHFGGNSARSLIA